MNNNFPKCIYDSKENDDFDKAMKFMLSIDPYSVNALEIKNHDEKNYIIKSYYGNAYKNGYIDDFDGKSNSKESIILKYLRNRIIPDLLTDKETIQYYRMLNNMLDGFENQIKEMSYGKIDYNSFMDSYKDFLGYMSAAINNGNQQYFESKEANQLRKDVIFSNNSDYDMLDKTIYSIFDLNKFAHRGYDQDVIYDLLDNCIDYDTCKKEKDKIRSMVRNLNNLQMEYGLSIGSFEGLLSCTNDNCKKIDRINELKSGSLDEGKAEINQLYNDLLNTIITCIDNDKTNNNKEECKEKAINNISNIVDKLISLLPNTVYSMEKCYSNLTDYEHDSYVDESHKKFERLNKYLMRVNLSFRAKAVLGQKLMFENLSLLLDNKSDSYNILGLITNTQKLDFFNKYRFIAEIQIDSHNNYVLVIYSDKFKEAFLIHLAYMPENLKKNVDMYCEARKAYCDLCESKGVNTKFNTISHCKIGSELKIMKIDSEGKPDVGGVTIDPSFGPGFHLGGDEDINTKKCSLYNFRQYNKRSLVNKELSEIDKSFDTGKIMKVIASKKYKVSEHEKK